jgi:hypothetical protein
MDERDRRYAAERAADLKAADAALAATKEAVAAALASAERAVEKAETNDEKWRANSNEWRGSMTDRERTFMPRAEAEGRLASLEKSDNQDTGKNMGVASLVGFAIAAASLGFVAATYFAK